MLGFAATVAFGAIKHYEGDVQQGGTVRFQTKVKHQKTKKVKKFLFAGVTFTCEGTPPFPISNQGFPVPAMKVHHRKFHGTFSQLGGTGRIRGKFKHHYWRAEGTLRVSADQIEDTPLHDCDTGTLDWTARKQRSN